MTQGRLDGEEPSAGHDRRRGRGPRLSLSGWILVGLTLGGLAGLFFGEATARLQPLAEIYIRLMQMTVLPYLVVSLVIGFGQLEAAQAQRLALRAGVLLLVTWALTFAVIAAVPASFPGMQTASFFSNALVEPGQPFSIPDLYFTANPFHSLANAVVPAVVLFSSLLGIGLIGVPGRERLLAPLRIANASIVSITKFIVALTPIGVFALVAVTAGTITRDTLERLEVYFVAFAAASLVLAFWILPLLVVAVTPFRYREVVGIARAALLTAFVANNAFIVLPLLVERSKLLLAQRGLLDPESDATVDILIPILFNFPNAGRLLTLLFVPFAAWLAGTPFGAGDFGTLLAVGVPSYFAKAQVALPFLLDVFKLPHDLFQLYIPTTVITGKFDSLVTAMNLVVFALVGAAAMSGFIQLRRARMAAVALAMVVVTTGTVVGARVVLRASVNAAYHADEKLTRMHAPRGLSLAIVHHRRPVREKAPADGGTLDAAYRRGTLRVGYDAANVPFSFFNKDQQLVGFDVELALQMAEALGVRAEFVPVSWPELPAMVASEEIDVMPGVWVRPYWFRSIRLSDPYLMGTVGLVVRDDRREEFANVESLRHRRGLRIGVPLDTRQLAASMSRYFAPTGVEFVAFDSPGSYFRGQHPGIDAFLMPAEGGAAATLLHPEYTVVVPQPDPVRLPYAFGVAAGAEDIADAINEWIVYATSEGAISRSYAYWILGQGAEIREPRWSVLRNGLGWRNQRGPSH